MKKQVRKVKAEGFRELELHINTASQTEKNKDFYTIKEIAAKSGLSYGTVKRAIDSGSLPAYHIGRKYFVTIDEGEIFCKENYNNQKIEGYTIQQIMEKIPLSYGFLMELVKNKELPTTKVGRQYIVAYKDYDDFIKKSKI